ncbi:MAG TPA: hypothetical protein VGC42_16390 [Kofleriaceae bacterium]
MTACTRCETVLEAGDLRCAICALPVPVNAPVIGAPAAERPTVLRCDGCGAAVGFVAAARAPRCGFCGHTMVIEQPVDPIEQAEHRVRFTVDRAQAGEALRGWLAGRGWFAPRELARDAALESLTPLAWAAWRVNAIADVAWTADSDEGARQSAWAPHAGQIELGFHDIVVPASRGLRDVECRALIPAYELSQSMPAAALDDTAPDAQVEQFDAQRSAARAYIAERITAAARLRVERHIPGRRHRNIHVACLIERQLTERIALPAWILAYRYRGQLYRAIVHGQRAHLVIGRAPLDRAKVIAVALAAAVIAAAVVIALVLSRSPT